MARSYLEGGTINSDIRNACLSAVSHEGSKTLFDMVKKAYEEKDNMEEKLALLGTLAEFTNHSLILEYINYATTGAVRRQDLRTVFSRVARNPVCPELFFDWVKENWGKLHELRKSHFVYIGLLQTLITTAPDGKSLKSISEFLAQHEKGYDKTKANAFEKAQLNISFREREQG